MLRSKPSRLDRSTGAARRLHWPRIAGAVLIILLCGGFWLALAGCAVNRLAPSPLTVHRSDGVATLRFVSDVHGVCAAAIGHTSNRRTETGSQRDGVTELPDPCPWPNARTTPT